MLIKQSSVREFIISFNVDLLTFKFILFIFYENMGLI